MKTIKENIKNELIIKNSKFITYIFKVNDTVQVEIYLTELRTLYKKANHHCYAYVINDIYRASDDGEPSSTAGLPILNVIKKNDLTNILVVVIRYFGGTLLGTGGLIKAYTSSPIECLKKAEILNLIKAYEIKITISYDKEKDLNLLLKNSTIVSRVYKELISYTIIVPVNEYTFFKKYSPTFIKDSYIEEKTSL